MLTILNPKKGTSLIEVIVAIFIFVIMVIGGISLFVHGRSQIHLRKHYRAASQLAAQKFEELKAGNYDDMVAGETTEYVSVEDLSYDRTTQTQDLGSYKKVDVSVNWQQGSKNHDVSLATFIAPK